MGFRVTITNLDRLTRSYLKKMSYSSPNKSRHMHISFDRGFEKNSLDWLQERTINDEKFDWYGYHGITIAVGQQHHLDQVLICFQKIKLYLLHCREDHFVHSKFIFNRKVKCKVDVLRVHLIPVQKVFHQFVNDEIFPRNAYFIEQVRIVKIIQ